MKYLISTVVCIIWALLGNWAGDQATLRDCAIYGQSTMSGRGTIECSVQKAQP